ncbi:hypothetical protein JCM19992_16860 [Thermostilla marina]
MANAPLSLWDWQPVEVCLDGLGGVRRISLERPFAVVGSLEKVDIRLSHPEIERRALLILAVEDQVWAVPLTNGDNRGHASLIQAENEAWRLGPYRIWCEPAAGASWSSPSGSQRPELPLDARGTLDSGDRLGIEVLAGKRVLGRYQLVRRLTLIGRHAPCPIVLTHRSVSGVHAAVFHHAGRTWLLDLHSVNGVWRGKDRHDALVWEANEGIRLGKVGLRLVVSETARRQVDDSGDDLFDLSPIDPNDDASNLSGLYGDLGDVTVSPVSISDGADIADAASESPAPPSSDDDCREGTATAAPQEDAAAQSLRRERQELETLRRECEARKRAIEAREQAIIQRERELEQREADLLIRQEELDALAATVQEREAALGEREAALQAEEAFRQELTARCEEREAAIDAYRRQVEELTSRLEMQERDVEEHLRQEKTRLRTFEQSLRDREAALDRREEELEQQLAEWEKGRHEWETERNREQASLRKEQETVEQARKDLERERCTLEERQSHLKELEQTLRRAEEDWERRRDDLERLRKQLDLRERQIEEREAEFASRRDGWEKQVAERQAAIERWHDELEQRRAALVEQEEQFSRDRSQWEEQRDRRQKELADLEEQLHKRQAELDSRFADYERQIRELEERKRGLQEQASALAAREADLDKLWEELKTREASWRERIAELERDRQELASQREEIDAARESLAAEAEALRERGKTLARRENELEERAGSLEKAEADVKRRDDELKKRIESLEAETHCLQEIEADLNRRKADLDAQEQALKQRVEAFEARCREWEKQAARREEALRDREQSSRKLNATDQPAADSGASPGESEKAVPERPKFRKKEVGDSRQQPSSANGSEEPSELPAAEPFGGARRTAQTGEVASRVLPAGEAPMVAVGRVPRFRRQSGKRYFAAAGLIVAYIGIAGGVYALRDRIVPPEYETTARIEFPADSLLTAVRDGYNPIAPESEPSGAKVLPNQSTLLMRALRHDAYFKANMSEDAQDRLSFLADRLEVYAVERLPFVRLGLKGNEPNGAEVVLRTIGEEYGKILRGVGSLRAEAYLQKIRTDLEDREMRLEEIDRKLADIEKRLGTRNPYQLEIQQQFAQQQIAALRKEKNDLQIERTTKDARRRELSRLLEDDTSVDAERVRHELEKNAETLKLLATEDVLVRRLAELQAVDHAAENGSETQSEAGAEGGASEDAEADGAAAVRLVRNQLTAVRKQLDPLRREAEQRVLTEMREEAEIELKVLDGEIGRIDERIGEIDAETERLQDESVEASRAAVEIRNLVEARRPLEDEIETLRAQLDTAQALHRKLADEKLPSVTIQSRPLRVWYRWGVLGGIVMLGWSLVGLIAWRIYRRQLRRLAAPLFVEEDWHRRAARLRVSH